MVWVSGDKICLGLANDYSLIDVNSGVATMITELFAPSSAPGGASFSSYVGMGMSMANIGPRTNKPLVTKLPNDEILLAKDREYLFYLFVLF